LIRDESAALAGTAKPSKTTLAAMATNVFIEPSLLFDGPPSNA
jgi:hypothetical protein